MDVPGQLEEVEQGRLGQTYLILKSGGLVFIVHLLWQSLSYILRLVYLYVSKVLLRQSFS